MDYVAKELAEKTGYHKDTIRQLFSQNAWWSSNAIFDVAETLDLELNIEARDRNTGKIYTPSGVRGKEEDLRHRIFELRNALREICVSSAISSVADCQEIAKETLLQLDRKDNKFSE